MVSSKHAHVSSPPPPGPYCTHGTQRVPVLMQLPNLRLAFGQEHTRMSSRFQLHSALQDPRPRVSHRATCLPSSRAAVLARESKRKGEEKRDRHLLRRQCTHLGRCPHSCALISEAEENRPPNPSMSLPLSYTKCFWFVHFLENKRHYYLRIDQRGQQTKTMFSFLKWTFLTIKVA